MSSKEQMNQHVRANEQLAGNPTYFAAGLKEIRVCRSEATAKQQGEISKIFTRWKEVSRIPLSKSCKIQRSRNYLFQLECPGFECPSDSVSAKSVLTLQKSMTYHLRIRRAGKDNLNPIMLSRPVFLCSLRTDRSGF